MNRDSDLLCIWLFGFSFLLAFFHILPPFLTSFFLWPLSWGDALDFLTPFVVIPSAFMIYSRLRTISLSLFGQESSTRTLNIAGQIVLAVGFLCYAEGHGLHLSANSLARLLQDARDSEIFKATYVYDEIISHFIWITGLFLISLSLILLAFKLSLQSLSWKKTVLLLTGAAFYGFTFTVEAIEGQTVVLAFPAAAAGFLLTFFLYLRRRKQRVENLLLLFFAIAYFLSLALFTYWGLSRSGFPQFSELGWI
jgi:hypothetical protein